MSEDYMGPWRFTLWALLRILYLAALLVLYIAYPLFCLWCALKWWEERPRK